eukprot:scaffold68934_cov47-Attheya_sp.AAC.1
MNSDKPQEKYDILIALSEFSYESTPEKIQTSAFCLAQWLDTFWIPTQRRKRESVEFVMDFEKNELHIKSFEMLAFGDWKKAVKKELKKIIVEDLGDMDATELQAAIPDEDPMGRARLFSWPESQTGKEVLHTTKYAIALPLANVWQGPQYVANARTYVLSRVVCPQNCCTCGRKTGVGPEKCLWRMPINYW